MRALEIESLALAQEKAGVKLRVFVGGPYVDLLADRPDATLYNGASRLRFDICKYISEVMEHTVTIGENRDLQDIYTNHLEKLFEASTFEIMHVRKQCDAVIIIPSSPGSFCELGYFSADNVICKKMLILRNIKYIDEPGYLHFGPSVQAKNYNAIVEDISYDNLDYSKTAIDNFLTTISLKIIASEVRIG